jgi:hypothetical protein
MKLKLGLLPAVVWLVGLSMSALARPVPLEANPCGQPRDMYDCAWGCPSENDCYDCCDELADDEEHGRCIEYCGKAF